MKFGFDNAPENSGAFNLPSINEGEIVPGNIIARYYALREKLPDAINEAERARILEELNQLTSSMNAVDGNEEVQRAA